MGKYLAVTGKYLVLYNYVAVAIDFWFWRYCFNTWFLFTTGTQQLSVQRAAS